MSAEALTSAAGDEGLVESLAGEAAKKMLFGARVAALETYRRVLELDSRHPDALREVARATADRDQRVALYRRAAAVDGLEAPDYLRWAAALLDAEPPRRRQALDVVNRLRTAFPGRSEELTLAAKMMAQCGELGFSAQIVDDISDLAGLSDDRAFDLVVVMKKLFDDGGPWAGQYWERKDLLDDVVRGRVASGLLLQAGTVRWMGKDYSGARQLLERIDGRGDDRTAALAAWLLLALAVEEERYEDALSQVAALPQPLDAASQLLHAEALHNTGQLATAESILGVVVHATPMGESGSDGDVDRQIVQFRALTSLAAVRYDIGNYTGHWAAIRHYINLCAEKNDLPLEIELALQLYRVAVDVNASPDALRRLAALRDTAMLNDEQIALVDVAQVEVHLLVVRSNPAERAKADSTARELVSRLKHAALLNRADRGRRALAWAAYVSVQVDDDDVARELLSMIGESGDWREKTLRAMLYMRASRPMKACEILGQVVSARHHDIDRRCLLGQAKLAAGNIPAALRDAEAIVRFAPNHVAARLLHADALYVTANGMPEDSTEHYLKLIEATEGYAAALRLHQGLADFLAGRPSDLPVGSEPLPPETIKQVARRCAAGAIGAVNALARGGLPFGGSVYDDARCALKELQSYDRPDACRLRWMLWQPRIRRYRYWLVRGVSALTGVALLLFAWFDSPVLDRFGTSGTPRLVTGVLGALFLLWPYITKFSVGLVAVERGQGQAPVAVPRTRLPLSPVGYRPSPTLPLGNRTSGPAPGVDTDANQGVDEAGVSAKGDAGLRGGRLGVTLR